MKKLLAVIMMVTMVVTLTGCGYKVVKTDTTEVATTVVEETTTEVATTEAPTTTTTTEPTTKATHECWFCGSITDNDIFAGHYFCNGCLATAVRHQGYKESDWYNYYPADAYHYTMHCYNCGHTFFAEDYCGGGLHYAVCPWCTYRNLM